MPPDPRARVFPLDFEPGRILSGKYRVDEKLGGGWEGEVYKVTELSTEIERVAKFYFPKRDPRGTRATRYARRLHALADSRIVTHYHHKDWIRLRRGGTEHRLEYLVSQYAEGEMLSTFLARQPGGRLRPYEALHLLDALARGIGSIHDAGEYHGDIHSDNILVRRKGIRFHVKLLDFFDLGRSTKTKQKEDIVDLARVLYEIVGGRRHYGSQPKIVKHICAGRRHALILERLPNIQSLLRVLDDFEWNA